MNIKKRAKKFACALLAVTMASTLLLAGCAGAEEPELSAPLKIGTLNGPTGMGMSQIMESPELYQVTTFQSPDEAVSKIVTGELDIAAVSSNLGAVLYNKLEGDVVLLATNTLGVLYIAENGNAVGDIADLKGKTIIASGKGGSPEFILNQLLLSQGIDPTKDVTVNWLMNHTDVASSLMAADGAVAMLPQPFMTIVSEKNSNVRLAVDLNAVWQETQGTALPMGILIAQRSLVEQRAADVEIFLKAYAESVELVNADPAAAAALISKHGIISDQMIAEKAIPTCNIVFISAQDSKEDLNRFYEIISEMDMKSVGGKIPDEAFYYSSGE